MFGCGAAVSPDDGGFKGINKNRKCTDVLCLLVFLVFCVAGMCVGFFAIENGRPESLVFGKDDNGNVCSIKNDRKPPKCQAEECFWASGTKKKDTDKDGKKTGKPKWAHVDGKGVAMGIDYENKKYVVYPRLVEDLFDASQQGVDPLQVEFFGICIDKCPTTAGWTCSPYGMGYLADTLAMETFPETLADKHCKSAKEETCKSVLNECRDNGIFNPTMPVTMHKYKSEKCSKLLKSCFYSPLQHTDTMFRCFPMYQQNVSYACDDDNDGKPDEEFKGLDGKPMNGGWQEAPFDEKQKTQCSTMIKRSLSQQSVAPNQVYKQIASAVAVIGRMIADLKAGLFSIVVCGIFIAVVCGFLWLILLRYCARVFVWLTIVLVIVMEASLCVFFYIQAGMIDVTAPSNAPAPGTTSGAVMPTELANDGDTNVEMFKWAAIGMTILLVIQFMGVIAAIKKINVAAEIISEASKAVAAMKGLMLLPVFPVIIISGIFMWFIYVAVCLYSIGEIKGDALIDAANDFRGPTNVTLNMSNPRIPWNRNSSRSNMSMSSIFSGVNMTASAAFKEADWGKYVMLFHVFVALWGNAFVQGFMTMTIAGAVSNWYFTEPEDGVKDTGKLPVPAACFRTIRYHLGSVAFGSGIIAAVQLARAIMMYIDAQTKTLQDKNICLKILMKIVHCILWAFEKCIKYLTKNAYIFISIKGSSFCWAAKDVFYCLKENMGQMAMVAGITAYLMLIGKVVIVASSTTVCYLMVMNDVNISSPMMPVLVTALLAFFIASVFLDVYAISIDTILISFCIDKKNNDGEKNKFYMSNKMRVLAGIKGTKDSCYARADDGENDDNVKPIGSDEGDKPVTDDDVEKADETSESEPTSSKSKHFDTDGPLI